MAGRPSLQADTSISALVGVSFCRLGGTSTWVRIDIVGNLKKSGVSGCGACVTSGMVSVMQPEPHDYIGTAEVARILGRSHRTVHRMVTDGRLVPVMKAPGGFVGAFLFNRADIEALREGVA